MTQSLTIYEVYKVYEGSADATFQAAVLLSTVEVTVKYHLMTHYPVSCHSGNSTPTVACTYLMYK